eukprot:TRINITY_DN2821_c1_g2_i1.p1 TRINITY_DN2821_c1_g2~~TRINITY_DN2821_c1_g2_i1.p1  ORF type:complete len:805 (+),score=111.20 TRINITY_DN2821_c1_g2_i1:13-2427(+)
MERYLPPKITLQCFTNFKIISSGSYGCVVSAHIKDNMEVPVALKFIFNWEDTSNLTERFGDEWTTTMSLNHPNIIKMCGQFTQNVPDEIKELPDADSVPRWPARDTKFLVMEYHPYRLDTYLTDNIGKVTDGLRLKLCLQLAKALNHLWERKIVHMDLKPDNVLLDKYLNLILSDFGCCVNGSKCLQCGYCEEFKCCYIHLDLRKGNTKYLAPEVNNSLNARKQVDLSKQHSFSLGIIMYFIFCQKHPYDGYPTQYQRELDMKMTVDPDILDFGELTRKNMRNVADLIQSLLEGEPGKRLSISDALKSLEEMNKAPINVGIPSSPRRRSSDCVCVEQLLSYDRSGFYIKDSGLGLLSRIGPEGVTVFSIYGPARSGKSFFGSRFAIELARKLNIQIPDVIFEVSHTTEPCTTGVWLCLISSQGRNYLIVDCEGTEKGDDTITSIVSSLSIAMASTAITIFQSDLNNAFLSKMAVLTTFLKSMNDFDSTIGLPSLSVVVTKAELDPTVNKKPVTWTEYLTHILKDVDPDDQLNECRRRIKGFSNKKVFPMEKKPNKGEMPRSCNPEFITEHQNIVENLLKDATKKTVSKITIDGKGLISLVQSFVECVKTKKWSSKSILHSLQEQHSAQKMDEILLEVMKAEYVVDGDDEAAEKVLEQRKKKIRDLFNLFSRTIELPQDIISNELKRADNAVTNQFYEHKKKNEIFMNEVVEVFTEAREEPIGGGYYYETDAKTSTVFPGERTTHFYDIRQNTSVQQRQNSRKRNGQIIHGEWNEISQRYKVLKQGAWHSGYRAKWMYNEPYPRN